MFFFFFFCAIILIRLYGSFILEIQIAVVVFLVPVHQVMPCGHASYSSCGFCRFLFLIFPFLLTEIEKKPPTHRVFKLSVDVISGLSQNLIDHSHEKKWFVFHLLVNEKPRRDALKLWFSAFKSLTVSHLWVRSNIPNRRRGRSSFDICGWVERPRPPLLGSPRNVVRTLRSL